MFQELSHDLKSDLYSDVIHDGETDSVLLHVSAKSQSTLNFAVII